MTIVVGTDHSEAARQGVDAAAWLARGFGDADLRLVHVLDPPGVSGQTAQGLADAAERQLAAEVERLHALTGVRANAYLRWGSPWQVLVDFAAAESARLLVVASRGHGSSSLFGLGSTSERIAHATSTPVLVVRDSRPFERWSKGERALRSLVAVDESLASATAFRLMGALRRVAACDVLVSHVYRADQVRRRYGLPPRLNVVDPVAEAEPLLVRDLARWLGDLEGSGSVEIRPQVGLGRVGDLVVDAAERAGVELIVVGTHRRRGLTRMASTTSVVLHYAVSSVAVVPAPPESAEGDEAIPVVRTVLVATDLSPFSNHAVRHAFALLGSGGGEVHVVHVVKPGLDAGARSKLEARLEATLPGARSVRGTATRVELIEHTDPAAAIVAAAARVGADVLCLASHARTGVRAAVLGSVAESVVANSRQPVLIVRPSAEPPTS